MDETLTWAAVGGLIIGGGYLAMTGKLGALGRPSPHFAWSEFEQTGTGLSNRIADNPDPATIRANIARLCNEVLEPLRLAVGGPVHINSGYRSLEVNTKIGGARYSQHMKGQAADIGGRTWNNPGWSPDAMIEWLWEMRADLPLGQVIVYSSFVHVSTGTKGEFLRSNGRSYWTWEGA